MTNKLVFAISILAALFGQSAVPIVYSIPIQNASFEYTDQAKPWPSSDACGLQLFGISNWVSSNASILMPTDITKCSFSAPPDGKAVALVEYGHPISQDLGNVYDILPHNSSGDVVGILSLNVYIANRYYWYDGTYTVSLSLAQVPNGPPSTNETLCSASGVSAGDFTAIPLVCPEQRQYGELTLNISATTPNWSIVADKVSLTFTPTN